MHCFVAGLCSQEYTKSPLHHDAGRFNERMVLSLASNPSCLLVDDELNILPTSSHVRNIEPLPADAASVAEAAKDSELKGLSESLADTLVSLQSLPSMTYHVAQHKADAASIAAAAKDSALRGLSECLPDTLTV